MPEPCPPQKQELLIAFYQTCWNEMSWRRYAGYRMIIPGMGYFGALLAGVLAIGTLGALMPDARRQRPKVPLSHDMVCLWSVLAFLAGGLLTATAILLV